jgi:hypothetical protein
MDELNAHIWCCGVVGIIFYFSLGRKFFLPRHCLPTPFIYSRINNSLISRGIGLFAFGVLVSFLSIFCVSISRSAAQIHYSFWLQQ